MPALAVTTTMLRTLPVLSRFSDAQLGQLMPRLQHRSYPRHTSLLRAGEKSDALYALVSGKVKIVIDDGEGREATLTTMGPGEFFGEMSCIDGKPRSASVVALDHCEVLYVPASALLDCLKHNFDAAMYLLTITVSRVRKANEKIASLALMDVRGRVARVFLDFAHDVDGQSIVDIGSEEIARMVGASREMVSRVIKGMIEARLVRRDKRKIIVLDRAALPHSEVVH
jgi:CRP/FNR family cyclic AMP-dependent transcriptional regulator